MASKRRKKYRQPRTACEKLIFLLGAFGIIRGVLEERNRRRARPKIQIVVNGPPNPQ